MCDNGTWHKFLACSNTAMYLLYTLMLCLKHKQQCFIGIQNHEAQPSGFRPDKTRAASFLNGFKNIPGKACVKRVHNNDAFVSVGNKHRILTRRRFNRVLKPLHVMFYRPF